MASSVSSKPCASLPAEEVRRELSRILADSEFAANARLATFLTYVVEKALGLHQDEIKESIIAIEVFGRDISLYDPRIDSIVRTEARRLREKLSHYYLNAGKLDPVIIEVPKGGYAPVFLPGHVREPALRKERPRVSRWVVVLAAAGMCLAAVVGWRLAQKAVDAPVVRTLTVLPFRDGDSANGAGYLSVGITEDLERDFSRVRGVELHASPSVEALGNRASIDYVTLARKLHANYLIDGAIEPSANGRQTRGMLIRGADGSILWTDHFALGPSLLTAEREIENGVAMVMGVPVPAPTRVENPQAHDLYLQGRNLWATRSREKTEQAIKLYQQALKLDTNYALAWMGIADAYGLMAANGQMPAQLAIQDGEEAASKAISLDPSLAEAHAALGLLKMNQWDWRAADEEFQRSIVLNPNYDRAYVRAGLVRFYLGDLAEADRLIRRAETLSPYSLSLPMIRAELYYYWRRYDDALDLSRHVQTIDPANATARTVEARTLLQVGRCREALEIILPNGGRWSGDRADLAPYLFAVGRRDEARALMSTVVSERARDFVAAYQLAVSFGRMGDRAQALEWLEKALGERSSDLPSMKWDPAFDFVRTDPRFVAVLRKVFEHS